MNTLLPRLLATAGALLASTALATPPPTDPMAYPVREVTLPNAFTIAIGTSEYAVRTNLGRPIARFGEDTVAYTGFSANLSEANRKGCGTLLITFEHSRVADLKLINSHGLRALAAHLRKGHPRIESAFLRLAPESFDLPAGPEIAAKDKFAK